MPAPTLGRRRCSTLHHEKRERGGSPLTNDQKFPPFGVQTIPDGGQERIRFGPGAPKGADRALPKTAVMTSEASPGCERSPETPYCESVSRCAETIRRDLGDGRPGTSDPPAPSYRRPGSNAKKLLWRVSRPSAEIFRHSVMGGVWKLRLQGWSVMYRHRLGAGRSSRNIVGWP